MPLGHMTCGGFSSPGFPREMTLAEEGSKVRASQCGITALGGHPNPAVPCLILRKLSSVSSSSWGGGSHSSGVLRQPGQAPQLPGPWWKMMDFLKNLLVSVPRLWTDAYHLGRRNRETAWRGVTEATGQSWAPVPFHPGLRVRDGGPGLGLGRTHLCAPLQGFLAPCQSLRGPTASCRWGSRARREGLCSWPGCRPLEPCGSSPCALCAVVAGMASGWDSASCHRASEQLL